jgi:transcription elongation factor GreA-like protein
LGRRIAALRQERERLIDTVWPAASSAAIRDLWAKVGHLLGDEPTQLERDTLAIKPEVAEPPPRV